jgi:enamine deaminase RidA (YjgF/YER057c/UK114 family)
MKPSLPLIVILLLGAPVRAADPAVRYVRTGDGQPLAAVVSGSAPLVHTAQFRATREEAVFPILAVEEMIKAHGGDPQQIVKLNVVARTQAIADASRASLRSRKPWHERPPVSFVVGALPGDAAIAVDAVAVAAPRYADSPSAHILPPGPRVWISGQAEKGATPAEATAKTIASLLKTLEFVGSTKDQVVQAKCFLTPMSGAQDVMDEFKKVFGEKKLPLVFVEWKSDLPIEIELIAAAAPAKPDAPVVEYLTPPGMKPSPLFARVVRVNRGDLIYTAGLYAQKPGTGEEQVLSIFEQLKHILRDTGCDMRHLAKATYYVSDNDASAKLNEIRPKYYDAQRPPAASKAMVPSVGMTERSIEIDVIGVVGGD